MKYKEEFYQKILEQFLQGTHMITDMGITDVTTDYCHAEIKRWDEHKQALGQILSYNKAMPRENLQIYFFDTYSDAAKMRACKNLKAFGIEVYEFIHESDTVNIVNFETRDTVFSWINNNYIV
jgi:hypothetical protein